MTSMRFRNASLAAAVIGLAFIATCTKPAQMPTAAAPALELPAAQVSEPFDVARVIHQVRHAFRPDTQPGHFTAGYQRHEVRAAPDGVLTLRPFHVRMEGAPWQLGPVQVRRGDAAITIGSATPRTEEDGSLTLQRALASEHLVNLEEGVEQSWSFPSLPDGAGPLVVDVPARGLDFVATTASGLHFADAQSGLGFRYGHGTWIDARGVRTPVPARFENGHIRLEVPEATLRRSAFPAVLDPIISAEFGIDQPVYVPAPGPQSGPAVASNGTDHLVVWTDSRNGIAGLIYGARVSGNGTLLDTTGFHIGQAAALTGQLTAVASNGTDYFVVWSYQSSASTDPRLRGTVVSAAGVVAQPNGVELTTRAGAHYDFALASDGAGYLAVWRHLESTAYELYATRISDTGAVLDSSGLLINGSPHSQSAPKVAGNAGGYLVAWNDFANLRAARVTSTGALPDGQGFLVAAAPNPVGPPAVASNGTGFLVAWTTGPGPETDVYAARIDPAGSVLDAPAIQLTSSPPSARSRPHAASDGTDYFVVWADWVDVTSDAFDAQVMGARVSSSGALLDATPLGIAVALGHQVRPQVSFGGGSYLVVWEDQGETEIFATRVATSGTLLDADPLHISQAANAQTSPQVATDGTDFLVVWTDFRFGQWDIFGARVAADGTVLDPSGFLVAPAPISGGPSVTWGGTDYFVVWGDFRADDWRTSGTRVSVSGQVLDPNGIPITSGGFELRPRVASNGDGYLVVWEQASLGPGRDIYGVRLDANGAVLDAQPLRICEAQGMQTSPQVASDGAGYLVVWEDQRQVERDIYGRFISEVGELPAGDNGFPITTAPASQSDVSVASHGATYFVAWVDQRNASQSQIYGAHLNVHDGVLQLGGVPVAQGPASHGFPKVASATVGYAVVFQSTLPGGERSLRGVQVTSAEQMGPQRILYDAEPPALLGQLSDVAGGQHLLVYYRMDDAPEVDARRVKARFIRWNNPPVASPLTLTTDEDTPLTVALTATDPDGDALTFSVVGQPMSGSVVISGGEATFTPAPNFHGTAWFDFQASDGELSSGAARATITVLPVNDAPVAQAQELTFAQGESVVVTLTAVDVDDDPLTYALAAPPSSGSATVEGDVLSWTPPPGFRETATLTFTASDGFVESAPGTVTIHVTNVGPQVTASADALAPPTGQEVRFSAEASDPGGDALTYAWDFGDGGTSTEKDPRHAFAEAGRYTVKVVVSDGLVEVEDSLVIEVGAQTHGCGCSAGMGGTGVAWLGLVALIAAAGGRGRGRHRAGGAQP